MVLHDFSDDIAAVRHVPEVEAMLAEVCALTGMGFAAIARVTEERWICCQVLDRIEFGLQPGDELKIKTTICDEIRASGELAFIEEVTGDPKWCRHHTPIMYGFESYISIPIVLSDGSFFGTLCAIDPAPQKGLANAVPRMEELAARIAGELDRISRAAST